MRIFPHYQDTGAFFVAVLEKTGPIYHKKERPTNNETETEVTTPTEVKTDKENNGNNQDDSSDEHNSEAEEKPNKRRKISGKKDKMKGYKEDPFVFFKSDEDVWGDIKEYYNISDEFDPQCLLTRCHVGKKKNIYYCSPAVKDIVASNQGSVKFINTGVKTFVRSDNRHMKCAFR